MRFGKRRVWIELDQQRDVVAKPPTSSGGDESRMSSKHANEKEDGEVDQAKEQHGPDPRERRELREVRGSLELIEL